MKHKKRQPLRLKMTTNELYAENMSTSHLSPHIYCSVLCSDQILTLLC